MIHKALHVLASSDISSFISTTAYFTETEITVDAAHIAGPLNMHQAVFHPSGSLLLGYRSITEFAI